MINYISEIANNKSSTCDISQTESSRVYYRNIHESGDGYFRKVSKGVHMIILQMPSRLNYLKRQLSVDFR